MIVNFFITISINFAWIYKHAPFQCIVGTLRSVEFSSVEYRTEPREVKARTELPAYRILVDELGYNVALTSYAVEMQLKDTGTLSLP